MSAPLLVLPDQDARFRLNTDASRYATRAILSQLCTDEKWHPIGFTSKSLSPAECNYTIYNKESLWVICGLEEWRHILEGTKHTIKILKDHQNLMYFQTAQTLNHCQAQWSLYLSQFDNSLTHRAGRHSAKPDACPDMLITNLKGTTTRIKSCSQWNDSPLNRHHGSCPQLH